MISSYIVCDHVLQCLSFTKSGSTLLLTCQIHSRPRFRFIMMRLLIMINPNGLYLDEATDKVIVLLFDVDCYDCHN